MSAVELAAHWGQQHAVSSSAQSAMARKQQQHVVGTGMQSAGHSQQQRHASSSLQQPLCCHPGNSTMFTSHDLFVCATVTCVVV